MNNNKNEEDPFFNNVADEDCSLTIEGITSDVDFSNNLADEDFSLTLEQLTSGDDSDNYNDLKEEADNFDITEANKDPLNNFPVTTIDTDENGNVIYTSIAGAKIVEGKYHLDENKTKHRVNWYAGDEEDRSRFTLNMNPDEWLSDVIKMLPCGLIDKQVTGIGATYLELHCERNSIIVTPTRALALNKLEDKFLYVGTKEGQLIATSREEIKVYLNNTEIHYKKILVVADSIDKVIETIQSNSDNKEDVFSNYFLLVDEIDTLQSDNHYRPVLSRVIDYYFKFKLQRRALLSATVRDFTHPKLKSEPLTIILPDKRLQRYIELFYTSHINSLLADHIRITLNEHPNEKILIAYNSVLNILSTIKLLPKELQNNETCAILCSEASRDEAGQYLKGLEEVIVQDKKKYQLPCRINFMTCSYFAGIDIDDSYHLITVSNCDKVYSALPINKIIQIYGRCRIPNGILSDTILYNNTRKPLKNLKTYRDILMKKAQKVIDLLEAAKALKEGDNDLRDLFDRIHKVIIEKATERLFEQQSFELVRDTIDKKLEISYFNIDALYEKMEAYSTLYSSKEGLYNQLKELYPATKFNDVSESEVGNSEEEPDSTEEEAKQRLQIKLFNNIEELISLSQENALDDDYLEQRINNSKRKEEEFYKRVKAHYQYYDINFLTKVLQDIVSDNKKSYRNLKNTLSFRALDDNHPFKLQVCQAFKEKERYTPQEIGEVLGVIVKDQFFKTLSLSQKNPSQSMLMNLFNSCVTSTYTGGKYLVKEYKPKFNNMEIPEPIKRIPKEKYAIDYFVITTQQIKSTHSTHILFSI